jgi:hypothetical protein
MIQEEEFVPNIFDDDRSILFKWGGILDQPSIYILIDRREDEVKYIALLDELDRLLKENMSLYESYNYIRDSYTLLDNNLSTTITMMFLGIKLEDGVDIEEVMLDINEYLLEIPLRDGELRS